MKRHLLGLLALGCLTAGGAIALYRGDTLGMHTIEDSFLRIGILLAVIWLALPDLQRLPLWIVAAVLGTALAVIFLFRNLRLMLPLVAGAVTLLMYLRPRGNRPTSRPR